MDFCRFQSEFFRASTAHSEKSTTISITIFSIVEHPFESKTKNSSGNSGSKTDPLNGLFSRTAWVSQHWKGKPIWILVKQEMMGVAVASAGPYANHLHLATNR